MTVFDLSLYLVLDPELCRAHSLAETTRRAVAGGVSMVQLRDKAATTSSLVVTGRSIKNALHGTGVPLIVNDDLEAAIAIDADGLHIGQGDLSVNEARQRLGAGKLLGLSVESVAQVQSVDHSAVDYVGIGPVFSTATKPDHKPPIGFAGLACIAAASPLPAVAIGGLKATHVARTLETGVGGLAVVSAICGQRDPMLAARELAGPIRQWFRRRSDLCRHQIS